MLTQLEEVGFDHVEAEDIRTTDRRPNIALSRLTDEKLAILLDAVDKWIDDVRSHAGEPETGEDPRAETSSGDGDGSATR